MIEKKIRQSVEGLEVGALDASEIGAVVGLISRGMRDNPLHAAAFGEDPEVRERRLRRLFGTVVKVLNLDRHMLAARGADGTILGVCGMMAPGECQPGIGRQIHLAPTMLRLGLGSAGRMITWMGTWSKHDPAERHWHLGPLAVDAHLQGRGIGSNLMRVLCAKMDAAGEVAYLETDKEINVRFYEKFGFEAMGEKEVLSVPNWFMIRRPENRR